MTSDRRTLHGDNFDPAVNVAEFVKNGHVCADATDSGNWHRKLRMNTKAPLDIPHFSEPAPTAIPSAARIVGSVGAPDSHSIPSRFVTKPREHRPMNGPRRRVVAAVACCRVRERRDGPEGWPTQWPHEPPPADREMPTRSPRCRVYASRRLQPSPCTPRYGGLHRPILLQRRSGGTTSTRRRSA